MPRFVLPPSFNSDREVGGKEREGKRRKGKSQGKRRDLTLHQHPNPFALHEKKGGKDRKGKGKRGKKRAISSTVLHNW